MDARILCSQWQALGSNVQGSRIQMTHAARPFSTTTARRETEDEAQQRAVAEFTANVESGKVPLEVLQQALDIDPAEYKAYAQRQAPHNEAHADKATVCGTARKR